MHHKRNGFTLAECLISVAVITVLVAVMIPIFQKQLEKSRESADLSNVRSAYAEVMTEVLSADTSNNIVRTVKLKQKQNGWQSLDPVSIAGITHYKNEGDTDNWKGVPTENGECEVSYNENTGIVFDWKGKSSNEDQDNNENDTDIVIKFNNDLHNVLTNTGYGQKGKCGNRKRNQQSAGTWDMGISGKSERCFRQISVLDFGRHK